MNSMGMLRCKPFSQKAANHGGHGGRTQEHVEPTDDFAVARERRSPPSTRGANPPSPRSLKRRSCECLIPAPPALPVETLDACEFVGWVIQHGLDAHKQPTPALRAVAKAWMHLVEHREGGKTLVLQKQGKVLHTAAHTPADAQTWRSQTTPPPEHHTLLRAIEARLAALGERGILRALYLPFVRQKENIVVGGTRFLKHGPCAYTLQESAAYGFGVDDAALDTLATFHAYLCYAADMPCQIHATTAGPLAELAASFHLKYQQLQQGQV